MAKAAGVVVMPILNFRFTPNYRKAKELLEQGAIGKPMCLTFREFITAKDLAGQWPLSSWAFPKKKCSLIFTNTVTPRPPPFPCFLMNTL